MSRLPRKPARFQPPLRGRAATQPQKRDELEQPSVAAYRPPARPPSNAIASIIQQTQSTDVDPSLLAPNSSIAQSTVEEDQRPAEQSAQVKKWGGLIPLWIVLGLLIALLALLSLSRSVLSL